MASIATTTVLEWNNGTRQERIDDLAGEEPLEIRLDGQPLSVTMRTPGHDLELVAGFLVAEGLAENLDSIDTLHAHPEGHDNRVEVSLVESPPHLSPTRRFVSSSACGVCGRSAIESLRLRDLPRPARTLTLPSDVLCGLPRRLAGGQRVFARTGALHAAGLFDGSGRLVTLREDIGRHNAVDKVVGWAMLHRRLPLAGHVLVVSGRGGFEVVQKGLAAGVEIVACVSAPSSLAVQLAREFGLTLVGFLRERRFVVYAGQERLC